MMTFFLFGKYTPESIQKISLKRTEQIVNEIKVLGGKVNAMHVLLGEDDLLLCIQLPGMDEAVKASVNLTRLTGISFKTLPAISVERFDQLTATDSH
ncbi:MAG: GYD domain-containing protein [Desulfobacterales bacterium]